MRDVYVLGVGMIKFGRFKDRDVHELAADAALQALADAGMTIKDIELLASGNLLQASNMIGQRILQQIGQTGIPVINVSNACATGSTAFRDAYFAVGSGEYEVAMAVGSEQMGKAGLLGGGGGGESVEGILGSGLMPAVFGQAGVEHMRQYGTTAEHFAKISVKNHKHSVKNPLSQYQVEVSLDDVMQARMVAYPQYALHVLPNRRWRRGRDRRLRGDGKEVRQEAGQGRLLGADVGSLDAARPDDAGREHLDAQRRQGSLRARRDRP